MNFEKIVTEKPTLSLKAMGLLLYISINDPELENTDKKTLEQNLKEGKDAINKAFNELVNHDIIELTYIRNRGKFIYSYSFNPYYL